MSVISIRHAIVFLQVNGIRTFTGEASQALSTFRLDFEVGKFVPFQVEFAFKNGIAFVACQTLMLLHVKREMALESKSLLTMLALERLFSLWRVSILL